MPMSPLMPQGFVGSQLIVNNLGVDATKIQDGLLSPKQQMMKARRRSGPNNERY